VKLLFLSALMGIALLASSARADVTDDIRRLREQSVLLTGSDAKKLLAQEWTKYGSDTLERREEALRRIRTLGVRLATDQNAGRSRECSAQIFLEAKWRALYTADFTTVDRRIRDLEASLDSDDQAYAMQQSKTDGTWGACFEPMFMKVEATMLGLQSMYEERVAPKYAVGIAPEIRSGEDAVALMASLLISDIAREGIDHRAELGALMTYGAQFQYKAYWQAYLENEVEGLLRDRDPGGIGKVRENVDRFLNVWQDPETGYWGAWYRVGNKLYRTTDLSITFHLISYLKGKVQYWPQIIDTTFKIEREPYPYGWRYGDNWNNHNNYDVVKILRYAWPHMTEDQQHHAREVMQEMLTWALSHSLQPDGSFAPDDDFFSAVSSDYYFGVSFFDEIGYWRPKNRFWTDKTFDGAEPRCLLIRRRFDGLQLSDPLAEATEEKLDENCGAP
jgi:hypothetical protein